MATDPASGKVVLFGGFSSDGALLGDTWTWDGSTWTQQRPPTSPSARRTSSIATDPATRHVVLFGGFSGGSAKLGDTWTWNGTTWTQQSPPKSPAARDSAAIATDPHGRVVLFGGADGVILSDTWSLRPAPRSRPTRDRWGRL
jgi:hypothetical protein